MTPCRLEELPGFPTVAAGIIVVIVVLAWLPHRPRLGAIPTVGCHSWLGSWWAGFNYPTNAIDVIQEGYHKHKSAPFKIANLYRWTVIITRREHVAQALRAPDDTLSALEAAGDRFHLKYTMGKNLHDDHYHSAVLRSQLGRNLETLFPEIRDETVAAFQEVLDLKGHEWKSVRLSSLLATVVCRTSNRIFVGLPLCRDLGWIDLNVRYTIDVAKSAFFMSLFPGFLRPLAACLLQGVTRGARRGVQHLRPIIEQRLKRLEESEGEGPETPNDLISWLIQAATGPELTVKALTMRVLFVNFAAIHTSSNALAQALYYLATNCHYIEPLRKEVETIVLQEGWSKATVRKMRKVDSFLRECQRLEGIDATSVVRKAMKDVTFSDGASIPKGTFIGIGNRPIQREEAFYENANEFKPFRFVDMHGEDERGSSAQFSTTTTEYLPFGHGKHACPGRFLAEVELKTMLAHIVVTYDIKLEGDVVPPPCVHNGTAIIANPHIKMSFRKRVQ